MLPAMHPSPHWLALLLGGRAISADVRNGSSCWFRIASILCWSHFGDRLPLSEKSVKGPSRLSNGIPESEAQESFAMGMQKLEMIRGRTRLVGETVHVNGKISNLGPPLTGGRRCAESQIWLQVKHRCGMD
jgi:hypothetical protein